MYKIEELREKTREELLQLISELKGKLLALRFESATGQLSESHLPSSTKKDIAKIFTVLKEKELGIVIETKEKVFTPKTAAEKAAEVKTEEKPAVEEVKEETTTPVVEETKAEEAAPVVEEVKAEEAPVAEEAKAEETTETPEEGANE